MNAMAPSTAAQVASRRARLWDAGFRPFALYSHDCLSHDCLTVPSDHRGKQLNLIPEGPPRVRWQNRSMQERTGQEPNLNDLGWWVQ